MKRQKSRMLPGETRGGAEQRERERAGCYRETATPDTEQQDEDATGRHVEQREQQDVT